MNTLRRTMVAVLVLSLLLGVVGRAAAHPLETVPPSHWAYAALRQLAVLGLIPFRTLAHLPLTRGEIAELVRAADHSAAARTLSAGAGDLLTALRAEFLRDDPAVRPQAAARGGWGNATSLTTYPALVPGAFAGLGAGAGWPSGVVWAEGQITSIAPAGVQLVRAYGLTRFGSFYLQAGREVQQWSPSARSSLLLGEWAGGVDMLRLVFDSGRLRFTKFASPLWTGPTLVYFVGTRLDWQATDRFRIGFSEAVLTLPGRMLVYALLDPFPVLLTQALDPTRLQTRYLRQTAQLLGTVDFDWLIRPGFSLAGQVLVDDYSADGSSPHRIGGLVLFTWADPFRNGRTSLRVEYSAVLNYTYTDNKFPLFNYILPSGRLLGYWLGNDADDLVVELRHVLAPGATLSGWLSRTRHGEGRIGIPMPPGPKKFKNSFLSGVVENRWAVGALYETHTGDRTIRYWGELASVQNQNNKLGRNLPEVLLGLEFIWHW